MQFIQNEIRLKSYSRGFHLITDEILNILPEIKNLKTGQLQVFIKHTSASLTINENADYTVRQDFESHFNKTVPENAIYYTYQRAGPTLQDASCKRGPQSLPTYD